MRKAHTIARRHGVLSVLAECLWRSRPLGAHHTAYTLRYAHLTTETTTKVKAPFISGGADPDGFDFAYFSFTLACASTSTWRESHQIRRRCLAHALLSFLFNTLCWVAVTWCSASELAQPRPQRRRAWFE